VGGYNIDKPGFRDTLIDWFENGIPFNKFLGLKVDVIEPGYGVLRAPWNDHLIGDASRPAIHGGVFSTLLDTTGGFVCFSMLEGTNDRMSTIDLRVDYLRPGPPNADILCEGRVVRMGNRVAVAQMEIYSGELPPRDLPIRERQPLATGQGVYNVVVRS